MIKERFAGRYELLEEAPAGAGGRLFQARDTTNGQIVAVKVFRQQLALSPGERADCESVFARAKELSHPQLVRFFDLSLDEGYLVREWVHGFSFLELLRRRREVPGEEAVSLLEGVAAALDLAAQQGLAPGGGLLPRLFCGFSGTATAEQLASWRGTPVDRWPDLQVKLNPLSVGTFLPTSEEDAMATMVNVAQKSGVPMNPPTAFAFMIYELLGGPRLSGSRPRYTPLPALNEQGNAVLRRTIEARKPPASCQLLWKELITESGLKPARKAVVPPPLPKRRQLRIPEPLLGSAQAGTMLKLIPGDVTNVPVHLVARPVFKLGRSLYHADFIARVLPETPENEKLTKELGRVHTIAEIKGDQLQFRDGNGEQPSVNGATFCDVPLSAERPLPLDRPGILALYRHYELDVQPLLSTADLGWEIANEKDWPGPHQAAPAVKGAVVFTPRRNQPMLRRAVWMFTRLDFAFTEKGEFIWVPAGSPGSGGSFLHHRGQFWLASFAEQTPPTVSGVRLAANSVAPLISGQVLFLGAGRYTVEVQ